ncbi:hypothetical protein [Leptothermofonsia sp. ETS-13]|uniref:hypothetical protein n=1 Tax=Leptothermofonsia sp. ETS-13 TaxID=3035696 RepID=UPI003BA07260
MNSQLDLTDFNPQRMKRLKTLTRLLAKSGLFQQAPVTVVHNLSHYKSGQNYTFEAFGEIGRGSIWGYSSKIQPDDHLILPNDGEIVRYRVEEIEHHGDGYYKLKGILNSR